MPAILSSGLLPLSARPESERWQLLERARPGLYREFYALHFEAVLRRPYRNSGVFLTPIDFRRLPDLPLARTARVALPVSAIDQGSAVLTYEREGRRVTLLFTPESLTEAAQLWTDAAVREWFGRDPSRLFFFVPQVAVYPEGAIPVRPEWVEP